MIVVDTSALAAILFGEAEAEGYSRRLAEASAACMSAVSYVELGMVTASNRGLAQSELDRWLERLAIEIVPVDHGQARRSLEAFRVYGRGRHPAGLNFGDCFAYALAKEFGRPLLFKGSHFARTDVELAA